MIFDERKMVRVLKLATPHKVKRMKRNKQLLLCEAPKCSCICMLRHVSKHLFIPFKIRKKDWAKWVKWAKMLKNTLTDEQLCSLICFFVSAFLNMYQNIYDKWNNIPHYTQIEKMEDKRFLMKEKW